jgi:hypothetical protein
MPVPLEVRSLKLWTLYDHPSDHPEAVVARRWSIEADGDFRPEALAILSDELEPLRSIMVRAGLNRLERNEVDDPAIIECWL